MTDKCDKSKLGHSRIISTLFNISQHSFHASQRDPQSFDSTSPGSSVSAHHHSKTLAFPASFVSKDATKFWVSRVHSECSSADNWFSYARSLHLFSCGQSFGLVKTAARLASRLPQHFSATCCIRFSTRMVHPQSLTKGPTSNTTDWGSTGFGRLKGTGPV